MPKRKKPNRADQAAKFERAAREVGADEDEARWEERLKRIAKLKQKEPDSKA